jgi:phage terminase large subunit-like protein
MKPTSKMTRGEKVIAFIETYCIVPEGKLIGKPMKLDLFQKRFIKKIYDNPQGTRLAILSMARKNGKTALIAALCLAHIVGPEARLNSQLVSGARSRDQAALVFNLMVKIIRFSEELSNRTRVIPSGKRIYGLGKNVEYQALAAEASTKHGLSPWLVIFDELGQVRGDKDAFVEALETAQGAYDDAMQIVISTQAPSDADLLSVWIDDAVNNQDPHTVIELHCAPEDSDLQDVKAWKKANPALGTFRSVPEITEMAKKAERMPSFESSFRNLYLNQRVNAHNPFVSRKVWLANAGEPEPFEGPVYGGVDLSGTTDLTAAVFTNRRNGRLNVLPFFWMPEAVVEEATKRDKANYELWVKQGHLFTTPGNVIDYDFVARDIGRITSQWEIVQIGFDRWRMDRLQGAFERQGIVLPLQPYGQGYKDMSPALDALEQDLLNEVINHGNNPVLTMCATNAIVVKDPADNRKLDKSKTTGRIDGMVALAMAEGVEAMLAEEEEDIDGWLKSLAS